MNIFSQLTEGLNFSRGERQDKEAFRGEECETFCAAPPQTDAHSALDEPGHVTSNDLEEAASIIRKHLRLYVRGNRVPAPIKAFAELKLLQVLDNRLETLGFHRPTAVQAQVVPLLIAHRDVIAISPTGSGKTLAFLLPILEENLRDSGKRGKGVSSLILTPGRELAQQTLRVLHSLTEGSKLHSALITGATAAGDNLNKVDILISTPLRLCRLLNPKRKKLNLASLRHLVLDETDKLLEEVSGETKTSFVQQIDMIMSECTNADLVISMYSATVPEAVERLARNVMKDPVRVTVGSRNSTAHGVVQKLQFVGSEEGKPLMLQHLLQKGLKAPVLVFVSAKEKALVLHRRLLADGYRVDSIFSDQDYACRQAALDNFRSGTTWVLISTDVLARGIDFVRVETVISYDCPASTADYVHRIGRTGRAGHRGTAITFFSENDASIVRPIANLIVESGQEVPKWMLAKRRRNSEGKTKAKKRRKTDTPS